MITFVAEGVETALSVSNAVTCDQVIAVLGKSNFKNIDPQAIAKNVVLCLDNDSKDPMKDKVILDSISRLQDFDKIIYIALPEKLKTDFNDLLKDKGIGAVKSCLDAAVLVKGERALQDFKSTKIEDQQRSYGPEENNNSNLVDRKLNEIEREIY